MEREEPIEQELLKSAMIAEVTVIDIAISPTSTGDRHVRLEGRLGDDEHDDVEWSAFGFIYAIGLLSFHDARPRGYSGMHFNEHDQWTAADMQRRLRYERGRLSFDSDYVRGRMMKTDVTIFPDGRFTLDTTNRGEAASRWVARIQGKKVLASIPVASEPESGD